MRGKIAPISDLSLDEAATPFFKPTFALRPGQVYQARPYVSPDTREWVIANATPVRLPAAAGRAIVHFEVTVGSFRHQAAAAAGDFDVAVVDGRSGKVVFDTANPRPLAEHRHPWGGKPHVHRLAPLGPAQYPELVDSERPSGYLDVSGRPAAFAQVGGGPHNANDWVVIVSSPVAQASWVESLGAAQIALIVLALGLLAFAVLSFRSSQRALEEAVLTDPLTGLGNRRKLVRDLKRLLESSSPDDEVLLAIFDLDGFKAYNDSFGHPAGDALLVRLATALQAGLASRGGAYRIGGDEFCVLLLRRGQR